MNLGDAWYLEPQPAAPAGAGGGRGFVAEQPGERAAYTEAQDAQAWSAIEARRAAETAPRGFAFKPIHFAIGGLVVLALFMMGNGKGR